MHGRMEGQTKKGVGDSGPKVLVLILWYLNAISTQSRSWCAPGSFAFENRHLWTINLLSYLDIFFSDRVILNWIRSD